LPRSKSEKAALLTSAPVRQATGRRYISRRKGDWQRPWKRSDWDDASEPVAYC
jgi:hypothetical protein